EPNGCLHTVQYFHEFKQMVNPAKDSKTAENISALHHAKQYPKQLHADGGKLFCTTCNVKLYHTRKFSINVHLNFDWHRHAKRKAETYLTSKAKRYTMS
ncbi:hypothetical protein KIL84_012852, partial [Mauremys mutica]